MAEKLLLKPTEAASLLGVCEATIRNWRIAGRIQFTKVGRTAFITRKEIDRFIRAHAVARKRKEKAQK